MLLEIYRLVALGGSACPQSERSSPRPLRGTRERAGEIACPTLHQPLHFYVAHPLCGRSEFNGLAPGGADAALEARVSISTTPCPRSRRYRPSFAISRRVPISRAAPRDGDYTSMWSGRPSQARFRERRRHTCTFRERDRPGRTTKTAIEGQLPISARSAHKPRG
jgi:hypothetical protein